MISPDTPPDTRRWWALGALCLAVLLVGVDNTIVNVALPTIGRELSATTSDLQWVVDGYTLAFAALLLFGGHLGDRFGRRRMLEIGLVAFVATSVLASFADTTGELVAGRFAMGVSAALIYPATLALLMTTFTDTRGRATAIGAWSAVSGLSVAIGPVSGGLLLEHFAWGSVFLVNLPLGLLALIAVRTLLTDARSDTSTRTDHVGVLASVAGVGLLVWTTIEAPNHGWTSTTTLVGYIGAATALATFIALELRRPDPLLDVRLFADRRFSAASGSIAVAFFGLFGFIFMVTQYFQVVRGYDTLTAGVATLPFAVVIGATSPVAIVVMRMIGTKAVVALGLTVMAAGFLLAAGTDLESAYWGRIVIAMVAMAAGLGLVMSPATEAVMGALRTDEAGAGSAVNDTVREIGGTLGVAVVGSVMSTVYAPAVRDGLTGAPEALRAAAGDSVMAGLTATAGLPADAVTAVQTAFLDGFTAGSLVCAGVCAVGAAAALAFLPSRVTGAPTPVAVTG